MEMIKSAFFVLMLIEVTLTCLASEEPTKGDALMSFECGIVRKNSYAGVLKTAKGHFYYDKTMGIAAYEYDAPFHYRFLIYDTVIYGIDTKNIRGYALHREDDFPEADDLYFSLHLFAPYLRCVFDDAAACSLKASIGPVLYLEKKNWRGSDMFMMERKLRRVTLIESFNPQGIMLQQTSMLYAGGTGESRLPLSMVVRKISSGVFMSDTFYLSHIVINRSIAPEKFALPAGCRLHEMRKGAAVFPFVIEAE